MEYTNFFLWKLRCKLKFYTLQEMRTFSHFLCIKLSEQTPEIVNLLNLWINISLVAHGGIHTTIGFQNMFLQCYVKTFSLCNEQQ